MGASEILEFILKGNAVGAVAAFQETATAAEESAGAVKASGAEIEGSQAATAESSAASSSKIGSAAVLGAAVAGVAVVELAKKWDESVLSAGKLAEATGLTVDAASRWSVVAQNSGVSTGVFEKSLNFMNKTAGNSPQKFADLGVALTDVNGNALSTQDRFLGVVDRLNQIEDPAARAAAASKLLGKGWTSMAELIGEGSSKLKESLDSVNSNEVFNADDVERAKKLRDTFKELGNDLKGVELAAGGALAKLAPLLELGGGVLTALVGGGEAAGKSASGWDQAKSAIERTGLAVVTFGVSEIPNAVDGIGKGVTAISNHFRDNKGVTAGLTDTLATYGQTLIDVGENAKWMTSLYPGMTDAQRAAADAAERLVATTDPATASIHGMGEAAREGSEKASVFAATTDMMGEAARNGKQPAADVSVAWHGMGEEARISAEKTAALAQDITDADTAYTTLKDHLDDRASWRNAETAVASWKTTLVDGTKTQGDQEAAIDSAKSALGTYVEGLKNVPASTKAQILTDIDQAGAMQLAQIEQTLKFLQAHPSFAITGSVQAGGIRLNASGTESSPGGLTRVGEQGAEDIFLPSGTVVHNATQTAQDRSMRGGGSLTVNVNVGGSLIHERDVHQWVADGLIDIVARGVLPAGFLG